MKKKCSEWIVDDIQFMKIIRSYDRKPTYRTIKMLKHVFVDGDDYYDVYTSYNVSKQLLYRKMSRFKEVAKEKCSLIL